MYGLFEAASAGEMNIDASAWGGRFSAQTRFRVVQVRVIRFLAYTSDIPTEMLTVSISDERIGLSIGDIIVGRN